jgi:hypothetical protein
MTTVHNDLELSPDGWPAAKRFFESERADLFEWMIGCLDPLPKPTKQLRIRRARCLDRGAPQALWRSNDLPHLSMLVRIMLTL